VQEEVIFIGIDFQASLQLLHSYTSSFKWLLKVVCLREVSL